MALAECKEPIVDRQVEKVLEGLEQGKSREELAKELGYKNPVSMDNYMRRRNFSWDSKLGKFVPAAERYAAKVTPLADTSTRAGAIANTYSMDGADPKEIARKYGFADHRELADYMTSKGYVWDSDIGNYVKGDRQASAKQAQPTAPPVPLSRHIEPISEVVQRIVVPEQFQEYLPLLQMLDENMDRLRNLLEVRPEAGKIPRYSIGGDFACKTVHMAKPLDLMIREFSKEKNITQRDLFEVALIEFFRKYGFDREVEHLLKG